MKIAIPIANGALSLHFGHCSEFAILTVEPESKQVISTETIGSPPHQPGMLPAWLKSQGVNSIIAGGMGMRAQDLFRMYGIDVVIGAQGGSPERLVEDYLGGSLVTGDNPCDH